MLKESARAPLQFSIFFFAADSSEAGGAAYDLLLDAARFADAHGFTAVWTPERHFEAFGGLYPSPAVTSAAVAVLTTRLKIRAGSVVLPFHDPVRVAEEWSMIDNLSGGRVAISFASGWHANDFVLAPDVYEDRRQDMMRKIAVVQALWRGESIVRPNGTGQPTTIRIRPAPVQPELPVWLTCQRDESFVTAGTLGFNVLTNFNFKKASDLDRKVQLYRDAIGAHHRRWGHVTLMAHTFVGDREEEVETTAAAALRSYVRTNLEMQQANERGRQQRLAGGAKPVASPFEMLSPSDRAFLVERATKQFIGEAGLIGTIDRCHERVTRLYEAGVDEIACLIDFGVASADVLQSLRRVADIRAALAPGVPPTAAIRQ